MKNQEKPESQIAVIGLGCYYPGATSPLQLWENILSRRCQFREIPDVRFPQSDYYDPDSLAVDKTYQTKAALIDGFDFDWPGKRIPKQTFESTDIVHWLALDTAIQALIDAGYIKDSIPKDKTGVVIGNSLTGEFTRTNTMRLRWPYVKKSLKASLQKKGLSHILSEIEPVMEQYYKSVFEPVTEDTLAGGLSNTIAGRICNYFDFHGGGYIVDGACSSSLLAICTAANHLANNEMDMVIAGGVDISLDTFELIGFAKTGALTHDEMHVYDIRGKGFLPGEGCGVVILKRLEDARRDGDYVYAILNGWGISSDGKGGITAPSALGQSMAIKRAYNRANFNPSLLHFIEGHGTGTAVGDKIELEGIAIALNTDNQIIPRQVGVTSFKSVFGHTKAAAGVGALIKTVIALNQRIIPPSAGVKEPNPVFKDKALSLYPVMTGKIMNPDETLFAGVSAMGFGGINSHIVLQSGDYQSKKLIPQLEERKLLVSNQDCELIFFTANDKNELITLIDNAIKETKGISYAELADFASFWNQNIDYNKKLRASIIAISPFDLQNKLQELLVEINKLSEISESPLEFSQGTVCLSKKKDNLRIAGLFPGQGAQKINMTRRLIERFEWARELMENALQIFKESGQEKIIETIYKDTDRLIDQDQLNEWNTALKQTDVAQPAIILASLLWFKYLSKLGIKISAVTGHSLGELTSFYAAGYLTEEEVLRFAAFRGKIMAQQGSGTMASIVASLEQVEEIIKDIPGYVTIANINSPNQIVISGEKDSILLTIKKAESLQIRAIELPVSAAFHSELIASASDAILNYLGLTKKTFPADCKIISSVSGKVIETDIALNEYFADQSLKQVHFVKAIDEISADCDVMLEIGPGRILSGLADVNQTKVKSFCVESNPGNDMDFHRALATLFVMGVDIHTGILYENRLIHEFVPAYKKKFIMNPLERPFPESMNGFDQTHTNSDLLTSITSGYEIPEETIKNYLLQRGDFIKDIILSDLKHSGLLKDNQNSKQNDTKKTEVKVSKNESIVEVPKKDIKTVIFARLEKLTGFPSNSIREEMKLLDDLNMDSIKSATFIAELNKELEVKEKIEPGKFSNATVAELINVFSKVAHSAEIIDKPVIKTIENIQLAGGVRSFTVEVMEEAYQVTVNHSNKIFENKKALILHTSENEDNADSIRNSLMNLGIKSDLCNPGNIQLKESAENFNCLIVLLPSHTINKFGQYERWVNLLSCVSHSSILTNKIENRSLVFIQEGNGNFNRIETDNYIHNNLSALSFAASVHLENPEMKIRVLEVLQNFDASRMVEIMIKELNISESFIAAGFDKNLNRNTLKYKPVNPADNQKRNIRLNQDDVVLVTGGAKGITSELAFAFAGKYHCKMALIGSSSFTDKSIEIQQTVDRYSQIGLKAKYYSCDVSDNIEIRKAIEKIETDLGKITGVIHGAGKNIPRRVEKVSIDEVFSEISPKLSGGINLLEAFDQKGLKLFVGLTSIIGITGMEGNAWYAFSNESLDMHIRNFSRYNPICHTLTLAYSIWDEIGMGHRMGSVDHLSKVGVGAIPPAEGVRKFLDWIENESPDQQVVVASSLNGLDTWNHKMPAMPISRRFLEKIIYFEPGVEIVTQVNLSTTTDLYLKDHNYNGNLLFPTVFGLEAMAQAVAYLTGRQSFTSIQIKNIQLVKPIVVPENGQSTIRIHAILQEPHEDGLKMVKAGISTQESSFSDLHFSAEFILNAEPIVYEIEMPDLSHILDINPKEDLYGQLLFQGSKFQKINKIYQLDSKKVIFDLENITEKDYTLDCFAKSVLSPCILGNPFQRDALLQSSQVCLTQNQYLPLRIDSWEIINRKEKRGNEKIVRTEIVKNDNEGALANVVSIKTDGTVKECIKGYYTKLLKPFQGNPLPEEFADLSKYFNKTIQNVLKPIQSAFEGKLSITGLIYRGLKSFDRTKRHLIEEEMFVTAMKNASGNRLKLENLDYLLLDWDDNVKPFISSMPAASGLHVSISHTSDLLLMSVGNYVHGIDIEKITNKDRNIWINMIGEGNSLLPDKLEKEGCEMNNAATRIWCTKETIFKATGMKNPKFEFFSKSGDTVIFTYLKDNQYITIYTVLVRFLQSEYILAFSSELVDKEQTIQKEENIQAGYVIGLNSAYDKFIDHFYTTFKDCRSLGGKTYFTNYPVWMGHLRELALKPIANQLLNDFKLNNYGMVTNDSGIKIYGEAEPLSEIEGHLYLTNKTSFENSFIDLEFAWYKRMPDNKLEKLASCNLSTTWVKITGHGQVVKAPLPKYLSDFLLKFNKQTLTENNKNFAKRLTISDLKDIIYKSPTGPRPIKLLNKKTFQTGIDDGNAVGNLYYSNYYNWQAKMVENYLNRINPDFYVNSSKYGELICLESEIKHLQEAMPFDEIEVRMYLDTKWENGIKLYFEYFSISDYIDPKKLAHGTYTGIWTKRDVAKNQLIASKLPVRLMTINSNGKEVMELV